jgi:hypothetical protein
MGFERKRCGLLADEMRPTNLSPSRDAERPGMHSHAEREERSVRGHSEGFTAWTQSVWGGVHM